VEWESATSRSPHQALAWKANGWYLMSSTSGIGAPYLCYCEGILGRLTPGDFQGIGLLRLEVVVEGTVGQAGLDSDVGYPGAEEVGANPKV
jgi:hypothetical protein